MTEQRNPGAGAATEPGPEVAPEVIQDLDVTEDDADDIVGGTSPVVTCFHWPFTAEKPF